MINARRRLAAIGDHHDGRFLELRFRAGITEIVFRDIAFIFGFRLGFFEEIMKRARAVMLRDEIDDALRQTHFPGEL